MSASSVSGGSGPDGVSPDAIIEWLQDEKGYLSPTPNADNLSIRYRRRASRWALCEHPLGKAGAATADGAGAAALRLPTHRRLHQVPAFTPLTLLLFPLPQAKSSLDPPAPAGSKKTEGTPRFVQCHSEARVS
jgi:hypothetical protein